MIRAIIQFSSKASTLAMQLALLYLAALGPSGMKAHQHQFCTPISESEGQIKALHSYLITILMKKKKKEQTYE